jgi:hypothetical protein
MNDFGDKMLGILITALTAAATTALNQMLKDLVDNNETD